MQSVRMSRRESNTFSIASQLLNITNLARASQNLPQLRYSQILSQCAKLAADMKENRKSAETECHLENSVKKLLKTAGYVGNRMNWSSIRGPDTLTGLMKDLLKPSDGWSLFRADDSDLGLYLKTEGVDRPEWTVIVGSIGSSKFAPVSSNSGDFNIKKVRLEVLELVNMERKRHGYSTLKMSDALNDCAAAHTKGQIQMNQMNHIGRDGRTPRERVALTGYVAKRVGENVAVGYSTAVAVMKGWMGSQSHRDTILNKKYTEMGLHSEKNGAGRRFWTQVFATPS